MIKNNKKIKSMTYKFYLFQLFFSMYKESNVIGHFSLIISNFLKLSIEVLSAEILNNKTYTFTFSQPVNQFIIGFSQFLLEYPESDHHLQKISVDLTNVHQQDNKILVIPRLRMSDASNNTESLDCKITVVVLAAIGKKSLNIYMKTGLKANVDYNFPLTNPTFVGSALTNSSVQYKEDDHHRSKFSSKIETVVNSNSFKMNGYSKIQDSRKNSSAGYVNGSVFIYNGTDHKILGSSFTSEKEGNSVLVKLGECSEEINPKQYKLACFINSFELLFKNSSDHHVKKIEVSCELDNENIVEDKGSLYAKIFLKSLLIDDGRNRSDLPNNSVSGFVVAFKNDNQ